MEAHEITDSPRVLVVDDETTVTRLIQRRLSEDGCVCEQASSARDALRHLKRQAYDVVVTDIRMPGMSGIRLLRIVKQLDPQTQVILMTGHPEVEFAVEAIHSRVDDYLIKPFELDQLSHAVARALEHRALMLENTRYRLELEERVREQAAQIERLFLDGIGALAAAIEARDGYTGGHLDRVSGYALSTGAELELGDYAMWRLWLGSLFHDVGKLAIPDAILKKPGPLTPEEYEEVKKHPELGARIVERVSFLLPAVQVVLHHQERFDGTGYPQGLKGDEICIEGRVLAVADTFDAMRTERPYRAAVPEAEALAELERCSGTQFDPQVVEGFMRARAKGFPWTIPPSPYSIGDGHGRPRDLADRAADRG